MKVKTVYEADTNKGLTTLELRQILNRGFDTKIVINGKPIFKVEYDDVTKTFNFIV